MDVRRKTHIIIIDSQHTVTNWKSRFQL